MSKQNLVGGTMLDVFMRTVRMKSRTEDLAATLVLTAVDPPLQFLDNGGAARTVSPRRPTSCRAVALEWWDADAQWSFEDQ